MSATIPFDPDWVVAPGETLAKWFEENGLPWRIAQLHGISQDDLQGLFEGTQPIDEMLAQRLSSLTRVSISFWLALEHNYRVGLAAGKTKAINGQ